MGRVGNGVTLSQLHSQIQRRYRVLMEESFKLGKDLWWLAKSISKEEESQGQWEEVGMEVVAFPGVNKGKLIG